jgi:sulfoquinovosidase
MRKRSLLFIPVILVLALVLYAAATRAVDAYNQRAITGKITAVGGDLTEGQHYFSAGNFEIQWIATGQGHPGGYQGPRLVIVHLSEPGRWLWHSQRGQAFVAAAQGQETVEEARGSYFISDRLARACNRQTVESISAQGQDVTVSGVLGCDKGEDVGYQLVFSPAGENQLAFHLTFEDAAINRAYLTYASDSDERFFGFGEQFSFFNHKGQRIPIWVSEQGIGRGLQPITTLVDLVARSGGHPYATYAAVPHYISSRMRSLFLENNQYAVFDLRHNDRVQVFAFAPNLSGRILYGRDPEALISEYTSWAGRMRPLPDWILSGAVIGMQGGTEKVRQVYSQLQAHNVPVAGFWLQDWVGQRTTSFGKQLWWNWELDQDRYPGWDQLIRDLEADDVRVMIYTSPFLANITEGENPKTNVRRDLFAEARAAGYLVNGPDGQPYLIQNTDFSAGLVDLTNPAAWRWYQDVLRDQLVGVGAWGWMADFGEALPYDAVLADGSRGADFHNPYPQEWARLNRELIDSLPQGDQIVFFNRAAFQRSPAYSTLIWAGDQLVTWDEHDGIKSAVTGMLSGGMSGFSLNHSDIGGYTGINNPLARYFRSEELLLRWMELSAFSTVYRTHEGNLPQQHAQFYDSEQALAHFSRMAKVYEAWGFLRRQLVDEAARSGVPVMRHLFIQYPADPVALDFSYQQYLLGPDLLVAPVLDPGADTVRVYLPPGNWVHLWSGRIYRTPFDGIWVTVSAPLGEPGVFYREESPVGPRLVQNLRDAGLIDR